MTKRQERDQPDSTWNRTAEDEPVFILAGRDRMAPALIRTWCDIGVLLGVPIKKVEEANDFASTVERWQIQNGSKVPD